MIYADNAATTKLDTEAFEAMKPFLLAEYGNASQPYSFARSAKNALQQARQTIATCIHANPEEIFFTSGGTESDNWAIKGAAFADSQKKATITSKIEHHAVLNSCRFIEQRGYSVAYLPVDPFGIVLLETLARTITKRTCLVSVMLANNEIGTVQPIKALCEIAHCHGATFHTDAVQALGHITIDVRELGIDLLSGSAHKFNGPKGVGFLYIKNGTKIVPYTDGGAQERGARAGTENVAAIVGMATALKKNCDDIDAVAKHLYRLEGIVADTLNAAKIDFIRNGSTAHIPGNLSLSFRGADGEMLLHRLDLMGIYVSTGAACDSVNTQVSHVLRAIAAPEAYAEGTIRISFGKFNTVEDAQRVASALISIVPKYRNPS